MTKVNPLILQTLRRRKNWSQDRLAEMANVNKQTISRIERGEQDNTRENTINRLSHALGVEPTDLTKKSLALESVDSKPVRRRLQSSFGVSDTAKNFLYLISERYFIKPWQVMELAPLLFCWAAETSLRQRRERLSKLEEACNSARTLENEMPHLPPPTSTTPRKRSRRNRAQSIHMTYLEAVSATTILATGPSMPQTTIPKTLLQSSLGSLLTRSAT